MGYYLSNPRGGYAWVVDVDWTYDPQDQFPSRKGQTGPVDAPQLLLNLLAEGKGRRWRTLYDEDYDGQDVRERRVHGGRYIDFNELDPATYGEIANTNVDASAEQGPLWDLSQPDCGATEIQFFDPTIPNRPRTRTKWVTQG